MIGEYVAIFSEVIGAVLFVVFLITLMVSAFQKKPIDSTQQAKNAEANRSNPHLSKVNIELWIACFVVMLIALPWGVFQIFSLVKAVQLILTVVALVGVWGYLRKLAFINQVFWKRFFWVYVVCLGPIAVWRGFGEWENIITGMSSVGAAGLPILSILVLAVPQLLALRRYAYACPHIWGSKSNEG